MLNFEQFEAIRGEPFTELEKSFARLLDLNTNVIEGYVKSRRLALEAALSGCSRDVVEKATEQAKKHGQQVLAILDEEAMFQADDDASGTDTMNP